MASSSSTNSAARLLRGADTGAPAPGNPWRPQRRPQDGPWCHRNPRKTALVNPHNQRGSPDPAVSKGRGSETSVHSHFASPSMSLLAIWRSSKFCGFLDRGECWNESPFDSTEHLYPSFQLKGDLDDRRDHD